MSTELKKVSQAIIKELEASKKKAAKAFVGTGLAGLEISVIGGFDTMINKVAAAAGLPLISGSTSQQAYEQKPVTSFMGKEIKVKKQPEVTAADITPSEEERAELQKKVDETGDNLDNMTFDDFTAFLQQESGTVIMRALGKRYKVENFETATLDVNFFSAMKAGKKDLQAIEAAKEAGDK